MLIGENLQAWRISRGHSLSALAEKAGLPPSSLEAIESGELDPTASNLGALATALGVPVSWLHGDPKELTLLMEDLEVPDHDSSRGHAIDPVVERILLASRRERTLFALLTAVLQSGEPQLLRAAEANLRSLAKQARQATVPWQSRPPGHFEPPSD